MTMIRCFCITLSILFIGAHAGVICDDKKNETAPQASPAIVVATNLKCPPKWTKHNSSCFYFEKNNRVPYSTAKTRCQENGATIYVPKSIEEYNAVMISISDSSYLYSPFLSWIGLTHKYNSTPKWNEGNGINYKELNWAMKSEDAGTRCAAVERRDDFLHTHWRECYDTNYFVCEGTVEAVSKHYETVKHDEPATMKIEKCQDGWLRFEDSCYLIERERKATFSDSKELCANKGAKLFTPNSLSEYRTIMRHTKSYAHTWTGLDYSNYYNRWESKTDFDFEEMDWLVKPFSSTSNGYIIWSDDYCGAYYNGVNYPAQYVYMYPCSWKYHFICEKTALVEVTPEKISKLF